MDPRTCCCVEWHKTIRVVIFAIVSLVHGLMLAGHGNLPLL